MEISDTPEPLILHLAEVGLKCLRIIDVKCILSKRKLTDF